MKRRVHNGLTGGQHTLDELFARHFAVVVAVLTPEEVHDAGLVVVHPLHVALAPVVKVKVLHPLHLTNKNVARLGFARKELAVERVWNMSGI
jgi:hypothetical protein